jgi:OTU domain-containing protein 6
VEAEYDTKYQALLERHQQELQQIQPQSQPESTIDVPSTAPEEPNENNDTYDGDEEDRLRQKKWSKKMQKRQQQRDREREREQAILEETARVGPTPREIEMQRIQSILFPSFVIQEVPADGHCLYRAVAKQLSSSSSSDISYLDVRNWVAQEMERHPEEYAPFCEYHHENEDHDFAAYVDRVRNTATWGGHLELRALASILHRPIEIYRAVAATTTTTTSSSTLIIVGRTRIMDEDSNNEPTIFHHLRNDTTPIRLSYHQHYYSLGEHYNCVVAKDAAGVLPPEEQQQQQQQED